MKVEASHGVDYGVSGPLYRKYLPHVSELFFYTALLNGFFLIVSKLYRTLSETIYRNGMRYSIPLRYGGMHIHMKKAPYCSHVVKSFFVVESVSLTATSWCAAF